MTNQDKERAEFESSYKSKHSMATTIRLASGRYYSTLVESAWHELAKSTKDNLSRIAELEAEVERLKDKKLPSCDSYLTEDDFADLNRFIECCEDSDADGHDVGKDQMKRLCELGVVRSCGFGRHELTAFGWYVHGGVFFQEVSLPLQTESEAMKGGA